VPRTLELLFHPLSELRKLNVVHGIKHVRGHYGLLVRVQRLLVGAVTYVVSMEFKDDILVDMLKLYSRVCQVIYKDGRGLGHGQYRIGLDLGVGRQHALGQPRYYGLW
jgi:hypothetical protein